MDRHYAGYGMPGPSSHNAATLPPVGIRGLSFSAYGENQAAAGGRQYSYPSNLQFSATLPANFPGFDEINPAMFPGFNNTLDSFEEEMLADWSEDQKKEREVILSNRVKLTQYIHDVTVLFPNMKQCSVFTNDDCHWVSHEITGTMKVDKFIDILLTKGPKAIGHFHSALETEYPALFEVLSRLFVTSGVTLPPERQLREDSEEDSGNVSTSSSGHSEGVSTRGRSVYRCGIKTIRKHFFELQRHCDEVQNQKDELQKSLIQREKEINSLLCRRDQVLNQKYDEFIRLMANWRELITIQSDDRLQKMQQLLSEREDIQSEYEQLEQEYMLVVSELNAAQDRISKLLNHLDRTSKEAGLTQEQLLDKMSQLEAEIAQKEGEIQRMNRQMNRVGKDVKGLDTVIETDGSDSSSSELALLEERLKTVQEERDGFEQRMKVALKERQGTLEENERLVSRCHAEKERRRKAEKSLQRLLSPQYPGETNSMCSGTEGATNEVEPLEEVTLVMPVEDMGLTLGTSVVVKELTDSGNASKSGVKLGDQLQQVNRIKISSDKDDPLGFAKKLLDSASQTVTLSVMRPPTSMPQGNCGGFPLTPGLANTPISPLPGTLSMSINPLEFEMERRYRKISAGGNVDSHQPLSLPISRPPYYKYTSAGKASRSTSASAVDTSDKDSDDSLSLVSGDARNDSDLIDHRISLASSHDFGAGIVTSPRASKAEHYPDYHGEDFTVCSHEDINILSSNGETATTGILTASHSESRLLTSSLVSDHVVDGEMNQSSPLHRRKLVKKDKRKRVVSKSLENIYKIEDSSAVLLSPLIPRGDKIGARQVLLPSGQLGTGLRIIGGRGNGYFIQSDRQSNRSLQSGDEIVAIGDKEVRKMNYAEVQELLVGFKEKGKCIIQVKSNLQGFTRLLANESSTRDNFYVRSKMSYHRPIRGGNQFLSYEKGDIFYVFDTLPLDHVGVWNVKKLNSRGVAIETGFIPVEVSPSETGEGASTLPPWIAKNFSPKTRPKSPHSLPPLNKQKSIPAAINAYKLYEPIKIVKMTEPRPVVLLGAHEAEIRRYLVEHGSNSDIKFAYCKKEPTENLADVPEDQIVETIETSDGPVASTVEYVHEIAKDGFHCVLCLRAEDLTRPGVASLTPIVLLLNPKRGFKIKLHHTGLGQVGNNQPATFQPEQIRELGRKYKLYITGELELSSTMHVTDITHEVREKVASQQKSVIWEIDS